MNADCWILECDLFCEDCKPEGADPVFTHETDTPQHCAECETLLDGSLTSHGVDYVNEAVADWIKTGSGREEIIRAWIDKYGVELPDLVDDGLLYLSDIVALAKLARHKVDATPTLPFPS